MAEWAKILAKWAVVGSAGFLLAGCSKTLESSLPPCPDVGLLADARRRLQFRDGPGRDLTDLQLDAKLDLLAGECSYNRKQTEATVSLRLGAEARRGPASSAPHAELTYFVAIVDKSDAVLARREFTVSLIFPADREVAAAIDELEQRLPLKENEQADAYRVLIGFKLTQDELDYNRLSSGQ